VAKAQVSEARSIRQAQDRLLRQAQGRLWAPASGESGIPPPSAPLGRGMETKGQIQRDDYALSSGRRIEVAHQGVFTWF